MYRVSRGQARPRPNGAGPQRPSEFLGPPTCAHVQILHGDLTTHEEIFFTVDHEC